MIILWRKVWLNVLAFFLTSLDFSLRKRTIPRDDNFCFAKFTCLNSDFVQSDLREADKMLEKQLRVCDTKEYMDTLTLNMRLLKDPELFFYIMVSFFLIQFFFFLIRPKIILLDLSQ